MKQVEKLVENISIKYRVDIEQYLRLYVAGKNREELAEALTLSEYAIRAIGNALNLRMANKYRAKDYALYLSRFDDSEVNLKLNEVSEDLDASYKDNVKLERQIISLRRDLAKYKSVTTKTSSDIDIEEIQQLVRGAIRPVAPISISINPPSNYYKSHTQFILLSDLHCEELVKEEDMGLSKGYTWEIMEYRLGVVIEETIQAYRGESKLVVMFGADFINGVIHGAEAHATNPVAKAVVDLGVLLSSHLNTLAEVYDEVHVMAVHGNHERLQQHIIAQDSAYGFSYMLYNLVKAYTIKNNVSFDISTTGFSTYEIGKQTILLTHGDFFRGPNNSTKVLKIKEAVRYSHGVEPKHIFQGHFHQPEITIGPNNSYLITNGSLPGPNAYSKGNGFIGIEWAQAIGSFLPMGDIENVRFVSRT